MKLVEGEGKQAQLTRAGRIWLGAVSLALFGPPLAIGLWKFNVWLWSL